MLEPAGPGGRERRFCLLREKLSQLSLYSGRKSFFIFFAPFPALPLLSRKKTKQNKQNRGAGEELTAERDFKRK